MTEVNQQLDGVKEGNSVLEAYLLARKSMKRLEISIFERAPLYEQGGFHLLTHDCSILWRLVSARPDKGLSSIALFRTEEAYEKEVHSEGGG